MVRYFTSYGLLSIKQYGFLFTRSTTDVLTVISEFVYQDKNSKAQVVALDISKVVDRVCHTSLLHKLKGYSSHGQTAAHGLHGFLSGLPNFTSKIMLIQILFVSFHPHFVHTFSLSLKKRLGQADVTEELLLHAQSTSIVACCIVGTQIRKKIANANHPCNFQCTSESIYINPNIQMPHNWYLYSGLYLKERKGLIWYSISDSTAYNNLW